jgi:hypothetical protein
MVCVTNFLIQTVIFYTLMALFAGWIVQVAIFICTNWTDFYLKYYSADTASMARLMLPQTMSSSFALGFFVIALPIHPVPTPPFSEHPGGRTEFQGLHVGVETGVLYRKPCSINCGAYDVIKSEGAQDFTPVQKRGASVQAAHSFQLNQPLRLTHE